MAEHTSPDAPGSSLSPCDTEKAGNSRVGDPTRSASGRDWRPQAESGPSRRTDQALSLIDQVLLLLDYETDGGPGDEGGLSLIDRILLLLDYRGANPEKCERGKKR